MSLKQIGYGLTSSMTVVNYSVMYRLDLIRISPHHQGYPRPVNERNGLLVNEVELCRGPGLGSGGVIGVPLKHQTSAVPSALLQSYTSVDDLQSDLVEALWSGIENHSFSGLSLETLQDQGVDHDFDSIDQVLGDDRF